MLKSLIMGLVAIFFILVGSLTLIMGYFFNNPDSLLNTFHSFTEKIIQGQKYEEKEEFFVQGIKKISVSSHRVDLEVKIYNGSTLKVDLKGEIPRFEQGPFITQATNSESLEIEIHEPIANNWVQMNVNGHEMTKESDVNLKAFIYVPEQYKEQLALENHSGQVTFFIPEHLFYEIDLQSVSGKIANNLKTKPTSNIQESEVGHIKIRTEQGPINIEPLD